MTAMNIIVQRSAGSVYLLSDTACTNPDGTVGELRSKVTTLALGHRASIAISSTGMGSQMFWRPHFQNMRVSSPNEFLASIPGVFRAVEEDLIKRGVPEVCGIGHMSAVVAIYDHEAADARGYAISNDCSLFNASRPGTRPYQPYTLQPVRKYLTRFVGRPFPLGTDLTEPKQWNPHDGAAALIDAQRADLFGSFGAQYPAIGGHGTLTKVSASGVQHLTVKRWPDRIGRRIQLSKRRSILGDRLIASINELRAPLMPVIGIEMPI